MWIEMSQDEAHGGKGWGFSEYLWCPGHKDPKGKSAYWELLREVEKDDVVLHLRGEHERAAFVGYSVAEAGCIETTQRPPQPGRWAYATNFLRVPLKDFLPFHKPLPVYDVFAKFGNQLNGYYAQNRLRSASQRRLIFFVNQSGKLQCQNGAYLSVLDRELCDVIFGAQFTEVLAPATIKAKSNTGHDIALMKIRIGQAIFSREVRKNYGGRCCFPCCDIAEHELLVGAHIGRWADAEYLRGETSNGLCLCLFHDRAFETGVFTLGYDFRVIVNERRALASAWATKNILPFAGQEIRLGPIRPSEGALTKHWERVNFLPNQR
jgi:putative restriction endonuclease